MEKKNPKNTQTDYFSSSGGETDPEETFSHKLKTVKIKPDVKEKPAKQTARPRSAKQIAHFERLKKINADRRKTKEAEFSAKEENIKMEEVEEEEEEVVQVITKPKAKPKPKPQPKPKPIKKPKKQVILYSSSSSEYEEEEEELYETSSEEEIIIKKKKKPIKTVTKPKPPPKPRAPRVAKQVPQAQPQFIPYKTYNPNYNNLFA
tara:strand:+ start:1761 stop:2375 length:615 start_codon:yes stop_codon:yes gene_type:complete